MKKNTMMRIASVLLVAVLLSTSVISGTFAKYVTSDSGSDTARVAKWGVTALVSGSLFGENYVPNSASSSQDEISATAMDSVDTSTSGEKIVAPGTKNTTGLTLSVIGTPEVANTVSVDTPSGTTNSDIWLKAGTYGTLVVASGVNADNYAAYYYLDSGTYKLATSFDSGTTYYELHDTVNVVENLTTSGKYYPIQWTLTKTSDSSTTNYRTVAELNTAIGTAFNTGSGAQNDPNEAIDKTYTITWAWAFDGQSDGADTILGNLQAGATNQVVVKEGTTAGTYTTLTLNTDYCLTETFGVQLTVTQVD